MDDGVSGVEVNQVVQSSSGEVAPEHLGKGPRWLDELKVADAEAGEYVPKYDFEGLQPQFGSRGGNHVERFV